MSVAGINVLVEETRAAERALKAPLLSVRGDVAEECWRIVDPVLAAWQADEVPMEEYPVGSAGPGTWLQV